MSKRTAAILLLLVLVLGIQPAESQGNGPRADSGVRSGGNGGREIVPRDGFRALFSNDRMAGLDAFVIYLLQNDLLVQTKYLFPQKHVKTDLFFEDFARVEEALRQNLGLPKQSGEVWRSGTRNTTADAGRMIAVGELTLKSEWETADMIIVHSLRGESLDIDHEVNYISKRLSPAAAGIMQELGPKHFF